LGWGKREEPFSDNSGSLCHYKVGWHRVQSHPFWIDAEAGAGGLQDNSLTVSLLREPGPLVSEGVDLGSVKVSVNW
jgi:hypothetical protein